LLITRITSDNLSQDLRTGWLKFSDSLPIR
jgi:hypothetical protein